MGRVVFFDNGLPRCPYNGKVSWATKAEAKARYCQAPGDRRRWRVFRCGVCDHYHVGHR
jgi:hypothetical protein